MKPDEQKAKVAAAIARLKPTSGTLAPQLQPFGTVGLDRRSRRCRWRPFLLRLSQRHLGPAERDHWLVRGVRPVPLSGGRGPRPSTTDRGGRPGDYTPPPRERSAPDDRSNDGADEAVDRVRRSNSRRLPDTGPTPRLGCSCRRGGARAPARLGVPFRRVRHSVRFKSHRDSYLPGVAAIDAGDRGADPLGRHSRWDGNGRTRHTVTEVAATTLGSTMTDSPQSLWCLRAFLVSLCFRSWAAKGRSDRTGIL